MSRKDRLADGRASLAALFPELLAGAGQSAPEPAARTSRADMRIWDLPEPTPEPVKVEPPEPEPEEEPEGAANSKPRPEPALDERTLGNLAMNTGEQALGAISDLFPSPEKEPEMDEEIEDPFGASTASPEPEPETADKRMLQEMQLSFQAIFGLGGKSEPDHKEKLEPLEVDDPEEPEVEVFKRPEDDPDMPRPSMM